MIKDIEHILQQVESLLRGGAQSAASSVIHELQLRSRRAMVWFSSPSADEDFNNCDENKRADNLSLAVKLHNKARNLTAPACAEIRTYLKATAAWMLCHYGTNGKAAKVLSIAVNTLSKCGRELESYGVDADITLQCLYGSVSNWSRMSSLSLHKSFTPVELQELKLSVFWANVEKAKVVLRICGSQEDVRKAVASAGEMVQALPSHLKMTFAYEVNSIAIKVSQSPELVEDAIHLFRTSLNALDAAMIPTFNDDADGERDVDKLSPASRAEIRRAKLNVLLCLSFLYMQTRDTAKALSCVAAIEQLSRSSGGDAAADTMDHTVLYAKYSIFLRDKDHQAAESALWALLKLALTPFQMALAAVKALDCEDHCEHIDAVPFYKHLAGKYPNEPEHTVIRINHLQTIVANVCLAREGTAPITRKALDITNSIVQAHIKREKVLSGENYQSIKHLISERIRWHRAQADWESTASWCDALVALLADSLDEKEGAVAVSVLKVDALINLGRYTEAVQLSTEVFHALQNTRTILMRFKAIAHAETEESAVDALREMHRSMVTATTPFASSGGSEYLSRLMLCNEAIQSCHHLSAAKRDKITQLLLREWVHRFAAEQLWKEAGESKDELQGGDLHDSLSADLRCSPHKYFATVCNYAHMYFLHVMEVKPIAVTAITAEPGETKMDCDPPYGANIEEKHGDAQMVEPNVSIGATAPIATSSTTTATASSMDFFTFRGYPDSLNSIALDEAAFTFACPLTTMRADMLTLFEELVSLVAEVESSGRSVSVLGSAQDLAWLARLAHNLAALLHTRAGQVYARSEDALRQVTIARLLEIAALLGGKQSSMSGGVCGGSIESATDLAACLLNAAAYRIDAEASAPFKLSAAGRELSLSTVTQSGAMLEPTVCSTAAGRSATEASHVSPIPPNNIAQARIDAQEADRLLQALADFDDPRAKHLHNMALLLGFSAVCKLGDQRLCQDFMREHHNALLRQSAQDLRRCAHIARQGVNLELARDLLHLALQNSVRDGSGSPDYNLMGALYCELIETSPSRRLALEKVEEFEQLANTLTSSAGSAGEGDGGFCSSFVPDDVDHIVSTAYNYGVTLIDLDQLEMAERFVCKAIRLLNVASATTKAWLPKMQDTYAVLLKAKTSAAGARVFCAPEFAGRTVSNTGNAELSGGAGTQKVHEPALQLDQLK